MSFSYKSWAGKQKNKNKTTTTTKSRYKHVRIQMTKGNLPNQKKRCKKNSDISASKLCFKPQVYVQKTPSLQDGANLRLEAKLKVSHNCSLDADDLASCYEIVNPGYFGLFVQTSAKAVYSSSNLWLGHPCKTVRVWGSLQTVCDSGFPATSCGFWRKQLTM